MYRRARLVVLVSGMGSNLQALLDNIIKQRLNAKIYAVVSNNPDAPALDIAKRYGIETHVIAPGFNTIDYCRPYMPDLIVCAGYMRIINKQAVAEYKDRIINIHPSIDLKYKGSDAIYQTLCSGDLVGGTTVHIVTDKVDTGRVIGQAEIDVYPNDNTYTYTKRIKQAEHSLYWRTINWYWDMLQGDDKREAL